MSIRNAAKEVAFGAGALTAYHRWRNEQTLTVLMFHRVLPPAESDAAEADPEWTVSTGLFEEIVAFVRRHYNPVSLDEVLAARAGRAALPARALLITFDDGWHDNLDCALPILRRAGLPATLFAASDAIDDPQVCWWQEVVHWALRSGRKSAADLLREAGEPEPNGAAGAAAEMRVLARYAGLGAAQRAALLQPLTRELERRQRHRHMLDGASLHELAAAGFAIGVHGAAHLPLTDLDDPAADLAGARRRLAAQAGTPASDSLSFPHGRYDARAVDAARRLGFKLLFTSDAIINSCPGGWLETDLVGRIPVFAGEVALADKRLSQPSLATGLFRRPHGQLSCGAARPGAAG